jgi:hypothetical protein
MHTITVANTSTATPQTPVTAGYASISFIMPPYSQVYPVTQKIFINP